MEDFYFCFSILGMAISWGAFWYAEHRRNRWIKALKFRDKIIRLIALYNDRRMQYELSPDGWDLFPLPDIYELYKHGDLKLESWYHENDIAALMGEVI